MQEVIIYRNPLEAAMWHGIMDSDFPIILFVVAMLIVSVSLFLLQDKFIGRKWWYVRNSDWFIAGTLLISAVASYFIVV